MGDYSNVVLSSVSNQLEKENKLRKLCFAATIAFGISAPGLLWAGPAVNSESLQTYSAFILPQAKLSAQPLENLSQAIQQIKEQATISRFIGTGLHQLSLRDQVTEMGVQTIKFQNFYKGLEVVGAMVFHHNGPIGKEISNYLTSFDLDTTPSLSPEQAVSIARARIGDRQISKAPVLKILPDEDSNNTASLVYWIEIQPQENRAGRDLIVDAHSGRLLADISHEIPITDFSETPRLDEFMAPGAHGNYGNMGPPPKFKFQPKPGYQPGNKPLPNGYTDIRVYGTTPECQQVDLDGTPVELEVEKCALLTNNSHLNPGVKDRAAWDALRNSQRVLSYYRNVHGRYSYDNRGTNLVSLVHVGRHFDNAFWSSDMEIMAYGDGDGKTFRSFTAALDVAGHEMTHGVISTTAKLLAKGQAGALNEAYADFFGKMIANDGDWAIGGKLFIDPSQRGIRDLENPGSMMAHFRGKNGGFTQKPYPSTTKEMFRVGQNEPCGEENDNCYVHVNSTIPGHASYLVVRAIGKEKAEKLYYLTMSQYLNPTATFYTARNATLKACGQLFDYATCSAVQAAFQQVGM